MNVKSGAKLNMESAAATNMKASVIKAQSEGATSFKAGGTLQAKGSVIKLVSPTKIKGTTLTVD